MNNEQMRREFEAEMQNTNYNMARYKNTYESEYTSQLFAGFKLGYTAAASSRDTELKAMQHDMEAAVDSLNQTVRENEDMRKAASSRDELVKRLVHALNVYLMAGFKEARRDASIIAKQALAAAKAQGHGE